MPTSGITALLLALLVLSSSLIVAIMHRMEGATILTAIRRGGAAFGATLALIIMMLTAMRR